MQRVDGTEQGKETTGIEIKNKINIVLSVNCEAERETHDPGGNRAQLRTFVSNALGSL